MPPAVRSDSDESSADLAVSHASQRPPITAAASVSARTERQRVGAPRAAQSATHSQLWDSSDSDDGGLKVSLAERKSSRPSLKAGTRRPATRARSDTNLVQQCAPGRALGPRPAIGRSQTTGSELRFRGTNPTSKRPGDAFLSGSDSELSADEELLRGRVAASGLGVSSSQNTSQGRKRSCPGPTEKQRQAEIRKAEREAARALKQQDRAEKAVQAERDKAWQQANKLRKDKAETMTELRVEFEYPLTTPSGPIPRTYELIKQSIEEDGAEVTVVPESEALSVVRIIRKSRATLDTIRRTFVPLLDGQVTLEDEKTVFVFVAHHHLLEMAEKKALMKTLRSFRVCMGYETHQIVLLTYGLDNFFRLQEQAANREYTQQIRNQVGQGAGAAAAPSRQKSKHAQPITITREQLDSELIRLRIAERVYLSKLEKEHDLVPWFVSMVRDVAIRPYKLLARSHLPISVNPSKFPSGANARETFELMLRQIPRITPQFAFAIVSHFGTLRAFLDRCAQVLTDSCGRLNEHGLPAASNNLVTEIAQIEVERTTSGQLASHRNKSALARRIVFVFLSLDALALVNS